MKGEYMTPMIEQLQEDLEEVLEKYREQYMSLAEMLGTLEVVKLNLWEDGMDREED